MRNMIVLVILVSVYEVWVMVKKKQMKEIIAFLIITVLCLSLGFFYLSNPYRESLAMKMLKLIGKEY